MLLCGRNFFPIGDNCVKIITPVKKNSTEERGSHQNLLQGLAKF